MAITKDQQAQDNDDFAAQFDADDVAPKHKTDEEEFGLADAPVGDAGATAAGGAAAAPATPAAGDMTAAAAAPVDAEQKRLQEWEAQLNAKEAELAAREQTAQTSSVEKTESGGEAAKPTSQPDEGDDPEAALTEDFGPEFVSLMIRLVQKYSKEHAGAGVSEVSATVDALIRDLRAERETNHFNRIRAAHEDFEDLTQSPEFSAWKDGQPQDQQAELNRVIESGSADQIIAMLTQYKQAKQGSSDADNDQIDAAEGVRSNRLELPTEPKQDTGYLDAWNNA